MTALLTGHLGQANSSSQVVICEYTILQIENTMTVQLAHDKALNGLSPQYLADDCQLITTTGRRRLRSSNVATCDVPQTCTTLGDRSFTAAGPYLWNNLPIHLRDFELSLFEFCRLLKTHFVRLRTVAPSDLL